MEQIRYTCVGAGAGFDHLFCVTVARNWASSSGKLAVYSSFTMHMYSGLVKALPRELVKAPLREPIRNTQETQKRVLIDVVRATWKTAT